MMDKTTLNWGVYLGDDIVAAFDGEMTATLWADNNLARGTFEVRRIGEGFQKEISRAIDSVCRGVSINVEERNGSPAVVVSWPRGYIEKILRSLVRDAQKGGMNGSR